MNRPSALHTSAFNIRSLIERFEHDPLTVMRLVPRSAFVCFADGDADEGGGEKPGKTFSQEDVEKIIKTRLKKSEADTAKLIAENEKLAKMTNDISEKYEKLNEKYESSNKSDVEKELAKATRALAKYEADLVSARKAQTDAEERATAAANGLKNTKLDGILRDALRHAKAHGTGLEQAVRLMREEGASLNDENAFQMTIADVPQDKPVDAAKKWLEANPHFVEGSGGGAGTIRSGGNMQLLNNEAMESMSAVSLIAAGLGSKSTP